MKSFEQQMDDFVREMTSIFHQAIRILETKRRTYGTMNLTKFGRYGILVRSSDKIERLVKMYENGTLKAADGESERDAWHDLMCYAALAIREIDLEVNASDIAERLGQGIGDGLASGVLKDALMDQFDDEDFAEEEPPRRTHGRDLPSFAKSLREIDIEFTVEGVWLNDPAPGEFRITGTFEPEWPKAPEHRADARAMASGPTASDQGQRTGGSGS